MLTVMRCWLILSIVVIITPISKKSCKTVLLKLHSCYSYNMYVLMLFMPSCMTSIIIILLLSFQKESIIIILTVVVCVLILCRHASIKSFRKEM